MASSVIQSKKDGRKAGTLGNFIAFQNTKPGFWNEERKIQIFWSLNQIYKDSWITALNGSACSDIIVAWPKSIKEMCPLRNSLRRL